MKLNRAPGGRAKLLSEHVVYEIEMLRATFIRLERPIADAIVANALIEAFCIHARNLIDFFWERGNRAGDYVAARHFTVDGYKPTAVENPKKTGLYGKLNAQVAHLTYARAATNDEKIQRSDRVKLIAVIEREIESFGSNLTMEYRAVWPQLFLSKITIVTPAATNSITETSSSGAVVSLGSSLATLPHAQGSAGLMNVNQSEES